MRPGAHAHPRPRPAPCQSRADWYTAYANQLASWGYAVAQYDTKFLTMPSVASELALLPRLLAWLSAASADAASPLHAQLDLGQLLTAGHSRGGKLAALALAQPASSGSVRAAYLLDPVDETKYSPASAENPSAAAALAHSGRPVGVTGAGIASGCNPAEGNYAVVFAAA